MLISKYWDVDHDVHTKKTCFYSKIGQLICNRHIYWWTKVENPGETTDLPQVTDNLIT